MKKKAMTKQELLSDDENPDYLDIMKKQLKKSQLLIMAYPKMNTERNQWHVDRNISQIKFREDKIFTLFTADPYTHFKTQWFYTEKLEPRHKKKVVELSDSRIKAVFMDLRTDKLKIQQRPLLLPYCFEETEKEGNKLLLKEQSQELRKKLEDINQSLSDAEGQIDKISNQKDMFSHLYSEEKLKQTEQWIQKKNEEKLERKRKIDEQRIKDQQEIQKQKKQKKQAEEIKNTAAKQQFMKKQIQLRKKRDEERLLRQQRNSQYLRVKQEFKEKPRLFQRLLKSYSEKRDYYELERKHELRSENKARYMHIDELKIQDHERQYEEIKRKKQEERQKKFEISLESHQRSRVKYHSSFELEKNQPDKSEVQKQLAKEKASKIREYQMIVKEKYQPRIDEVKRKEMLTLIQEAELNKRKMLKKKYLEDGKILYEPIKQSDPRDIGMKYLEMTKQMANKARANKDIVEKSEPVVPQRKKQIDYLQYFRKNPRPKPDRLDFIDRKNLSYEQKLDKVFTEVGKLNDNVKVNEDKLKFGKFSTSDEILNCKEEIDQNYLDIAFMKLRMIKEDSKS